MPTEISVSIVAPPWRAAREAARWNPAPATSTTGVESASATHSQPEKRSAGTIETSTTGTVRTAAGTSLRATASAAAA